MTCPRRFFVWFGRMFLARCACLLKSSEEALILLELSERLMYFAGVREALPVLAFSDISFDSLNYFLKLLSSSYLERSPTPLPSKISLLSSCHKYMMSGALLLRKWTQSPPDSDFDA